MLIGFLMKEKLGVFLARMKIGFEGLLGQVKGVKWMPLILFTVLFGVLYGLNHEMREAFVGLILWGGASLLLIKLFLTEWE